MSGREKRQPNPEGGPAVPWGARATPSEDLYAALQCGDEARLEDLLPPLREGLRRLAKQRLPEDQAEDAVQEALTTLWEKRASLEGPRHVLPFLFQVLRYKVGDVYLRRDRAPASVSLRPEEGAPPTPGDRDEGPELAARQAELDGILDRAIAKCGEENELWGRILKLRREGLSGPEIREALGGVPLATIYTRTFRARKRLREILRADFGLEL